MNTKVILSAGLLHRGKNCFCSLNNFSISSRQVPCIDVDVSFDVIQLYIGLWNNSNKLRIILLFFYGNTRQNKKNVYDRWRTLFSVIETFLPKILTPVYVTVICLHKICDWNNVFLKGWHLRQLFRTSVSWINWKCYGPEIIILKFEQKTKSLVHL